jgi:hypothetical protein
VSPGHRGSDQLPDEQSLAAVRESEALVELLASRVELHELEELRRLDPLAAALGGWVSAIDQEVAATAGRPHPAVPLVPVGGTGTAVPARTRSRVVPVRRRTAGERERRAPWWLLSASAAAVIAVLGVGIGLQDVAPVQPAESVAESVESIEATLVASQRAAQAGDVVGARVLLEQARAMVEALPAEERGQWEVAVAAAERGLRTAEQAVRRGEPVPGTAEEPGRPGDAPTGRATSPTAGPAAPVAPGPAGTVAPAPAPTSTTAPTSTSSTSTTSSSTTATTAPEPEPEDEPPGRQTGRPPGAGTTPATPGAGQGGRGRTTPPAP